MREKQKERRCPATPAVDGRRGKTPAFSCPSLEEAFSLDNILAAALRCRRGVSWKGQVQSFHLNMLVNCLRLQDEVLGGTYRPGQGRTFRISERGKPRIITSMPYRDRVVQRTLCDFVLVPAVEAAVIPANSACLPGRGTTHALDLLQGALEAHWAEHGLRGGIMLFDFSKYFTRVRIDEVRRQFHGLLDDERLEALLAISLGDGPGLELGSQAAQLAGVLYPNEVDWWAADAPGVGAYDRYMDDGYAMFADWCQMRSFAREFETRCGALGIVMNPGKFRFVRVGEEFTFLKIRMRLCEDGRAQRRLTQRTLRKHRQRVRRLRRLVASGVMDADSLTASEAAWKGVLLRAC